jgi:hypothetical protein
MKLNEVIHNFQQLFLEEEAELSKLQVKRIENKFNAAKYLYLSHQVAKMFPDLIESQIILKYSTTAPNIVTKHEEMSNLEDIVSSHHIVSACARAILTSSAIIGRFCLESQLGRDCISQFSAAFISSAILYAHMELFHIHPVLIVAPTLIVVVLFHFIYNSNTRSRLRNSQIAPIIDATDSYDESKTDGISQFGTYKDENSIDDVGSDSGSEISIVTKVEDTDYIINMVNARIRELNSIRVQNAVEDAVQLEANDILELVKAKCNDILKTNAPLTKKVVAVDADDESDSSDSSDYDSSENDDDVDEDDAFDQYSIQDDDEAEAAADETEAVDDETEAVDDETEAVDDETEAVDDETEAVDDETEAVDDETEDAVESSDVEKDEDETSKIGTEAIDSTEEIDGKDEDQELLVDHVDEQENVESDSSDSNDQENDQVNGHDDDTNELRHPSLI